MNRKYVKYVAKKWLPFFFILLFAIGSIPLLSSLLSTPYAYADISSSGETYYTNYPTTLILHTLVPGLIATFILPFAVYSFRYGRRSADCYLSFPAKPNSIRNTRLLVGLVYLEIAVFCAYWLSNGIFAFRQAVTNIPAATNHTYFFRYMLAYQWSPLVYLCIALAVAAQYFANCFFVSLGNNVLGSIIMLIAGDIIMLSIVFTPVSFIYVWLAKAGVSSSTFTASFFFGAGWLFSGTMIYTVFNPLMLGNNPYLHYLTQSWDFWLCLILYVGFAVFAAVYVFKRKDPSGEYFGAWGPRNKATTSVIHLAGALLLFMSFGEFTVLSWFFYLPTLMITMVWSAGLYIGSIALYRRSFRLPKYDWITAASVIGVFLLSCILYMAI